MKPETDEEAMARERSQLRVTVNITVGEMADIRRCVAVDTNATAMLAAARMWLNHSRGQEVSL